MPLFFCFIYHWNTHSPAVAKRGAINIVLSITATHPPITEQKVLARSEMAITPNCNVVARDTFTIVPESDFNVFVVDFDASAMQILVFVNLSKNLTSVFF